MPQSRLTGLLLIVTGALTFLGTTNQLLPAVAFFPGLVVCVLGVFVFLKANHVALSESQRRTHERLHPVLKSKAADALANRQAAIDGASLEGLAAREGCRAAQAASAKQVQDDELVLYEVDQAEAPTNEPLVLGALEEDDGTTGPAKQAGGPQDPNFVVTTDVSFPIELQQQSSLADQLAKLRRLTDDGIISEDEFAVAKAKLLA